MAEPTSPVALIYRELMERWEELKNLGRWLDTRLRVAVVGAAETMPGELYRALCGQPKAEVTTLEPTGSGWTVAASFELSDVPGLGRLGGAAADERALGYLVEADAVLVTVPVLQRPGAVEQGLWDHLKRLKRARLVVVVEPLAPGATPRRRAGRLDAAAWDLWVAEIRRALNESEAVVLPCRGMADDDLVKVARGVSDLGALSAEARAAWPSLVEHAPSREALLAEQITSTANTAAFLGLSPIPFSDVAAITPLQVMLVCRVAAAYGKVVTPSQAQEFIGATVPVLAAGLGFRQIFRRLAGRLGEELLLLKLALGAGTAWTGTQVIGRAAVIYYRALAGMSPAEAAAEAQAELAAELGQRNPFAPPSAPPRQRRGPGPNEEPPDVDDAGGS